MAAELGLRQPQPGLEKYILLIQSFVDSKISAPTFENCYLELVKNDPVVRGEPTFGIIDELFFYVDEYFDDPDSTEQEKRGEDGKLRRHAQHALSELKKQSMN